MKRRGGRPYIAGKHEGGGGGQHQMSGSSELVCFDITLIMGVSVQLWLGLWESHNSRCEPLYSWCWWTGPGIAWGAQSLMAG